MYQKLKKNQTRKNKLILFAKIAAILLLFLIAAVLIVKGFFSEEALVNKEKKDLPSPVVLEDRALVIESDQTPVASKVIQVELNLDVPFTSQAPHGVWDKTHEDACEEATVLMAKRYFENRNFSDKDDAEKGIHDIVSWEMQNLGFFESTDSHDTIRIITEFLKLKAELIENPQINDIKEALNNNKLVLVPAAGRELGNPFYKSPGPLYHFLLIKGYTETKFITNDPGTRHGANYIYDFKTILDANRDWNGGDVSSGKKVMIFVSSN